MEEEGKAGKKSRRKEIGGVKRARCFCAAFEFNNYPSMKEDTGGRGGGRVVPCQKDGFYGVACLSVPQGTGVDPAE